ncbi:centromere protein R isoform X3 [Ovis aries]|uniref:centromere protein R isoform X3 n=1 Tax=Ovis aries TaxID=9940 RepID=UPI0005FB6332|nr:centromere protein R isoform X3 [Ovis aries]
MALSLFPGGLLVRILKEGRALPWQGLSAVYVLTLLPSYWHTLGSLVAGGMFPAGCFECSTASSDHSPAVFRLQSFSWKVLCLRELFSDFIRRRRCVPESQNASFDSPKITRKKSAAAYSPTTGTCQMSPVASPTSSKEQENRNGPSNGKRENLIHLRINKRMESTVQDNELMMLLSKVEKSSEEFMEIMQNLSSIQALKGSKELENLIGIPHTSCVFKREMQKTKELSV